MVWRPLHILQQHDGQHINYPRGINADNTVWPFLGVFIYLELHTGNILVF